MTTRLTARSTTDGDSAGIQAFVEELEAGFNQHDSDTFNRHFTDDVVWGNPGGGVLQGWNELHSIHTGFFTGPMSDARSHYSLQNLLFLQPDIAVIHVKREPIDASGTVIATEDQGEGGMFAELAMYVMIQRQGEWWLCAGQNTPIG